MVKMAKAENCALFFFFLLSVWVFQGSSRPTLCRSPSPQQHLKQGWAWSETVSELKWTRTPLCLNSNVKHGEKTDYNHLLMIFPLCYLCCVGSQCVWKIFILIGNVRVCIFQHGIMRISVVLNKEMNITSQPSYRSISLRCGTFYSLWPSSGWRCRENILLACFRLEAPSVFHSASQSVPSPDSPPPHYLHSQAGHLECAVMGFCLNSAAW